MEWLGLPPAMLATIFGLTASALVALHLVRRQRRERIVPFLELFVRDRSEARALTFLSRRLLWLSLLLLVLVAGALVAATGDPRWRSARSGGKDIVLAIDVSRSMGALESGRSRLDRAKEEARALVRSLAPEDRVTLLAIAADAESRSPTTGDPSALLAAIDALEVEDVHEDLGRAVELTNELLAGRARPVLVLLGDGASAGSRQLDGLARGITVYAPRLGRSVENVGIVAFAARRYRRDPSQAEVRLVLRNAGERPRPTEIVLESAGRALDVRRVDLAPGETHEASIRHLGGADASFVARIRAVDGSTDALPADDVAYATLPPRPELKLLVVSADDLYLEAAALLDESVVASVVSPEAFAGTAGYDVVVFDATLPPSAPSIPALYLAPRPVAGRFGPFTTRGERLAPPITRIAREDPLVRDLDLEDVAIARAPELVILPGDDVLVSSRSTPLLVRGRREGHPFLALGFDLRETDLPLRMAFPVFFVRALEELARESGDFEEGFRTDSIARIPVHAARNRVRVVDPRGRSSEAAVVDGFAIVRPRHVGLHRIEDDDGTRVVAAGLGPADESAIRSHAYERHGGEIEPTAFRSSGTRTRPWLLLVALAAGLLAFEWLAHHRRWTA